MKRILLIAPVDPEVFNEENFSKTGLSKFSFFDTTGKKGFSPPLNLATIAALTPEDIRVDIWDEAIRSRADVNDNANDYDLVGITGYSYNIPRAIELSTFFREKNIPVAIGGVGVSMNPELCRDHFDILFIGEAEHTWPQFISDWKAGSYHKEYRQIIKPDLVHSPPPKWDSLLDSMDNYIIGSVQTTRGCPFNCEFCDVTYLFGKNSRQKPIDAILEEVANLERLGVGYIFFNDDNFIGRPRYAKKLLKQLLTLNNSFENPLEFGTQVSMNVAQDEELLELLADTNFGMLLIGIETVNKESLKETNKLQNLCDDLVATCAKVQSYGMYIKGTMIVGFDSDDKTIFEKQFNFLQQAHIPVCNINQLKAPPGTKLWRRLLRDGRVIRKDIPEYEDNIVMLGIATNIIPKQMSRAELLSGTADLIYKIRSWESFTVRIKGYVSGIKRIPRVAPKKRKKVTLKMLYVGLRMYMAVDKDTRRAFFEILSYTRKHAPYLLNRVIAITVSNYFSYYMSQQGMQEVQKLIEIEKGLDASKYIDDCQVLIPRGFENSFKDIYIDIYQRVKSGLSDKTRTEEALVEVFTDFLTRSGRTFDQMADHHINFLHELSDLAVTRFNLESKEGTPAAITTEEAMPVFKHQSSSEDIFNIIEQNLRV